jgi:nucleotide-binding universal stress UspA family protein
MALRDILVQLDGGPRSAERLAVAVALARRHEAHLTGLGVIDLPSVELFYGSAMPFAGLAPEQIVAGMHTDGVAAMASIEAEFRAQASQAGVAAEWRLAEGNLAAVTALAAHTADLTVLGQPNRYDPREPPSSLHSTVVHTVMTSGRPVLAVPFAGRFPVIGDRVLIAWNATREAARAVNDALPLLAGATLVTVVAVNPPSGGEIDRPGADLVRHLGRHGVRAEAVHTVAKDISAGDALLSYAADIGADLIVAGAYGHSRAREMVFGGVTRTLLSEMTVPVLLSH